NEQPMQTPRLRPLARGRGLLRHAPLRGTPPRTLHRGPQQPHQGQAAQARPQAPAEREHRQPRPVPPHHRQAQRPLTSLPFTRTCHRTEAPMTDLDIIDAEVVEDALSYGDALDGMNDLASAARDINDRIERYAAEAVRLWSLRAWEVLGHKSWAECVEARGAQLRLPRADRREMVALLADEGMSSRAIAPVVGASPATVKRDIGSASFEPDAPRTVKSLDGVERTFQPRKPATTLRDAGVVDMATGEIYDPATVTPENRAERQAERERMLGLYTDA